MTTIRGFKALKQNFTDVATLNEALFWIMALKDGVVQALNQAAPPGGEAVGDLYAVADSPTGGTAFEGEGGKWALYLGTGFSTSGWKFRSKEIGDTVVNAANGERIWWDGTNFLKTVDNSVATGG